MIEPDILKKSLQPEFLERAKVIGQAVVLKKSVTRHRTAQWYRQAKFNLMREESEGFSKLVVALSDFFSGQAQQHSTLSGLMLYVNSLTGLFRLDPNRIIDCVINCTEQALRQTQTISGRQIHFFLFFLVYCFLQLVNFRLL